MKEKQIALYIWALIFIAVLFSACSKYYDNRSSGSGTQISHTEIQQAETGEGASIPETQRQEDGEGSKHQMAQVDADGGLRMRNGPGTEHDILKVVPQHEYVQLIKEEKEQPGWAYVYYDGAYGWMSTEFLSYESSHMPTSNWAKAYYDFLLPFEAITYTSTIYGGEYIVAGHKVDGELRGSNLIAFWNVQGYDYPILSSNEIPVDANGNSDSRMFASTIYLIKDNKVVEADEANLSIFFQASADGPGSDVKGDQVITFVLKPENGGSPENVQKALEWLQSK